MYYQRCNEKCLCVTSAIMSKAHQAQSFYHCWFAVLFSLPNQDNTHEVKSNFSLLTMSWGNTELFRLNLCRLSC